MALATLFDVASHLGIQLPRKDKRAVKCPFRDHKRKNFKVYQARESGAWLWKCWSCDPPDNVGDAVAFYARFKNIERRLAWRELRDKGFTFSEEDARRDYDREQRNKPYVVPVAGRSDGPVVPFDLRVWRRYVDGGTGAVERFVKQRGLDLGVVLGCDVVQVDQRSIGFGYRDPHTLVPCRVKVRVLDKKMFWIEPKSPSDKPGRALSPLYLAHDLNGAKAVVITEGEVDALTLRSFGKHNVVSLPDGTESAGRVDITPISRYDIVLVSFDADDAGEKAYLTMRERIRRWGKIATKLIWKDSAETYKDANAARMAGKGQAWFDACIENAMEAALGYKVGI